MWWNDIGNHCVMVLSPFCKVMACAADRLVQPLISGTIHCRDGHPVECALLKRVLAHSQRRGDVLDVPTYQVLGLVGYKNENENESGHADWCVTGSTARARKITCYR